MTKTYDVIWTKTAKEDLIEIIQFIKFDSQITAIKILNKIKKKRILT